MTLPHLALHVALCASLGAAATLCLTHGYRGRGRPRDGRTGGAEQHTTREEPT